MDALKRAVDPFRFCTRMNLTELTGLSVSTVEDLLSLIKTVPGSCIYHHTHRFLQQHQYLSPEPPNDFAHWVTNALGDNELGERLASIDTIQYSTIRGLRAKIVATIEEHVSRHPAAGGRLVRKGEGFHFMKSVSFILPTSYVAYDLREFAEILKKVTIDSIYFHVFEARLRLERGTNDFSFWIESSLGETMLAKEIARLDPYTRTLDNLRRTLIQLVEKRISEDDGLHR
ncbi:MAG: DUF5752 family protein [Candidatus Krumholzibacteria bacterium]|nr:DUF5752 family protein [Candidatus Krumholzibacteria bacterium]